MPCVLGNCSVALAFQKMEVFGQREMSHLDVMFLMGCSLSLHRMMEEAGGHTERRDMGLRNKQTEMLSLPPKEPAPLEETQDQKNKALRGYRGDVRCLKEGFESGEVMEGNYKCHALEAG